MKPVVVLSAVMVGALAAIPATLWYLVKVKKLNRPR